MTQAWTSRYPGKWIAAYQQRPSPYWTMALNALGKPILCDSEELAHSVAAYRLRRLQPLVTN